MNPNSIADSLRVPFVSVHRKYWINW